MEKLITVIDFLLAHKMIFSLLIISLVLLVRHFTVKRIRGDIAFLTEDQRKWISRTKNGSFSFIVIILFIALSVTAIAVAIVVASKEIILCFTGSIQRASSRSFRIGDWIEVGTLCGEVIEHNMMATVIQEIDLHHGQYNYTGKTATLPNSMFFTYPVKNLNFMKRYVYHKFSICVRDFVNLYPTLPDLLEKIDTHCEDFIEVARRYNGVIEKHAGVDLPGSEPHIHIASTSTGEQKVYYVIFCPTEKASHLEQLIRQDFMEMYEKTFPKKED